MMKLKTVELYVDCTALRQGNQQYTCWANEVPLPVGVAWVQRSSNQGGLSEARLLHIYTPRFARRNRVASVILRTILRHHQIITTGVGSKDGGEALLKSFGFSYDRNRGDWVYVTKKPKGHRSPPTVAPNPAKL